MEGWRLTGKASEISWRAEQSGPFTLAVQYVDRDLNYSKLALVGFTVFTPWYANARVIVPGGGVICGLVVWAFVARSLVLRRKREAAQLRERLLKEERKARAAAEQAAAALEKENDERRRAEEEARQAQATADQANQAKSQFLASMSHELRTPLNAIIGYSEMLVEVAEEDGHAGYVPDLAKIRGAAKHQLGLINDILDLSKIEAGKMTLFIEELDVARLVNEVAATVQPLVAKEGGRCRIAGPCSWLRISRMTFFSFRELSSRRASRIQ